MHNTVCINNSKNDAWSITLRKSTELEQFLCFEIFIIIFQQPCLEKIVSDTLRRMIVIRVIFSENRVSEDTHEKSIFLLFRQNVPFSELIQGKIV